MAAFRILLLIAAIPLPASFGRPLCAHCPQFGRAGRLLRSGPLPPRPRRIGSYADMIARVTPQRGEYGT